MLFLFSLKYIFVDLYLYFDSLVFVFSFIAEVLVWMTVSQLVEDVISVSRWERLKSFWEEGATSLFSFIPNFCFFFCISINLLKCICVRAERKSERERLKSFWEGVATSLFSFTYFICFFAFVVFLSICWDVFVFTLR